MPKVTANDINVHYQTKGEGPDIVMIHGITSNLFFWYLRIFPSLIKEFRVTIYDLRGHGHTDMPRSGYTLADMAYDLDALLVNLDIKKTHLVGHSFGGLIALHYTMLHPEKVSKIVIADADIPFVGGHLWNILKNISDSGISMDSEESGNIDIDNVISQVREKRRFKPIDGLLIQAYDRMLKLARNSSLLDDLLTEEELALEEIKQPILAIYGEYSPTIAACRYLSENLPNCRSIIVPNAGHLHPMEQSDFFVKNIMAFLNIKFGESV